MHFKNLLIELIEKFLFSRDVFDIVPEDTSHQLYNYIHCKVTLKLFFSNGNQALKNHKFNVYLRFYRTLSHSFSQLDFWFNTEVLGIKILPDENNSETRRISRHAFEYFMILSIEYLGHNAYVDSNAIRKLIRSSDFKGRLIKVPNCDVTCMLRAPDYN